MYSFRGRVCVCYFKNARSDTTLNLKRVTLDRLTSRLSLLTHFRSFRIYFPLVWPRGKTALCSGVRVALHLISPALGCCRSFPVYPNPVLCLQKLMHEGHCGEFLDLAALSARSTPLTVPASSVSISISPVLCACPMTQVPGFAVPRFVLRPADGRQRC